LPRLDPYQTEQEIRASAEQLRSTSKAVGSLAGKLSSQDAQTATDDAKREDTPNADRHM